MTFKEILRACASGEMPCVETKDGTMGQVVTIKSNGRHKGIAVYFSGVGCDTWFTDSDDTDNRTKYMRDLRLVSELEYESYKNRIKKDGIWISLADRLPIEGELVNTKVDDKGGCRNKQQLKRSGNLWFEKDVSMYVYYTPTHWQPINH